MAPGTERGAAGLKAERLDALSTAMYAIPNEWVQIWAVPPVKKTASSSASVLPIEKALGEHSDEHALTH